MLPIKTTLLVNGISSGITGIGLVMFAKEAAQIFGVNTHLPFTYTGLFLIGFAVFVISAALRKTISRSSVRLITTLDILWVIASVLLVIADGSYMTIIGNAMILAVAAWVGLMAVLQSKGVKGEMSITNVYHP